MSRFKPDVVPRPLVEQKDDVEKKSPIALKSDSALAGGFRTAALCRTKNGWAVAMLEIGADGKLLNLDLGNSQSFPDPVVGRLVKQQMALNQETLRKYPWRPGG